VEPWRCFAGVTTTFWYVVAVSVTVMRRSPISVEERLLNEWGLTRMGEEAKPLPEEE